MSMFRPITLNCPACGTPVEFSAVLSVNADRRPDLRGHHRRFVPCQPCPQCGATFRLDPEFTFVDIGHGQWIAAFPLVKLGEWRVLEEKALATFAQAYGPSAPAVAREMGAGMKPRLVFGWSGLREKLIVADNQLDDVTLELSKMAILRTSATTPLSDDNELRLLGMAGDKMEMAWIRAATEEVVESLSVPRCSTMKSSRVPRDGNPCVNSYRGSCSWT